MWLVIKIHQAFQWGVHDPDSGNNCVDNYCHLNKSLTIQQCNLRLLVIEIFKTKNNLNSTFMKDIFAEKYHTLRNPHHLQLPKVRTTIYGTEIFSLEAASYDPHCPIV